MSRPSLPPAAPGEVLLVCTCYEDGRAQWGGLPSKDQVLADGGVRLRPVEHPAWDYVHGCAVPALVPDGGSVPPVAVLVDIPVVFGGDGPLLVDLAAVPGRGVRVPPARLGEVLAGLLGGALAFDDLVRGMDRRGMYLGDAGRPAFPVPAPPPGRSFPALPSTDMSLLVRTSFDDEAGWHALLKELGGIDEDGCVGMEEHDEEHDGEHAPLAALVVDDRAYEGLHPGEVPALVPLDEHTTLVALADARTFAEPGRPLTAVDLYDTPGQPAVLPCREVGSLADNLEIGNMDFFDFVAMEGVQPWWDVG